MQLSRSFAVVSASWVAVLLLVGGARAADAVVVEYFGPHPIDPGVHDGLCTIEGPHMHSYRPHDEVLYVHDGPYWTFVGDPTEFEPVVATRVAYYGHHPVWWTHGHGEHYCYITGPHHHGHRPPPEVAFSERGGAYWYVGVHPVWYERGKHRHKHLDDHYHAHHLMRPVVTYAPPRGWVGVQLDLGPVGVGIGASFGAPVVIEHVHEQPVVIEHVHHDHPGKGWGHHKNHPGFPGKNGRGHKHKGKHK